MTPEEFLKDMEDCYGPCGRMCLSCPEAHYLADVVVMVKKLVEERDSAIKQLKINNIS